MGVAFGGIRIGIQRQKGCYRTLVFAHSPPDRFGIAPTTHASDLFPAPGPPMPRRLQAYLYAAIASAIVAAPRNAQAQQYVSYWADSGATSYIRALDDTTVLELTARYAPIGGATNLTVTFRAWRVRCVRGANVRFQIGLVWFGDNEASVLTHLSTATLPIQFDSPTLTLDRQDGARLMNACLAVVAFRRSSTSPSH